MKPARMYILTEQLKAGPRARKQFVEGTAVPGIGPKFTSEEEVNLLEAKACERNDPKGGMG